MRAVRGRGGDAPVHTPKPGSIPREVILFRRPLVRRDRIRNDDRRASQYERPTPMSKLKKEEKAKKGSVCWKEKPIFAFNDWVLAV
ncbi:hypothetical protein PG994_008518 [Apiospora phragmitis]|uniref:Uncharacterized protein n=1 Tax=Apiospora phragmitis TaxID=2905665 RepID=A0ABR1UJ46_9PEZI